MRVIATADLKRQPFLQHAASEGEYNVGQWPALDLNLAAD